MTVLKDCLEHFMCFCFNCLNSWFFYYILSKIWYMNLAFILYYELRLFYIGLQGRVQTWYKFILLIWFNTMRAKRLNCFKVHVPARISAYFISSTWTRIPMCLNLMCIDIICVWYMFLRSTVVNFKIFNLHFFFSKLQGFPN